MKEQFYKCWCDLAEMEWPLRGLDVDAAKVNPETGEVDDDESKNTKVEIWLETGEPDGETNTYTHNIDYDCGAETFEEAIIELHKLITNENR